jgi:hypothetical protein
MYGLHVVQLGLLSVLDSELGDVVICNMRPTIKIVQHWQRTQQTHQRVKYNLART